MTKHTIQSLQTLVKTLRTERNNYRAMYEHAKDRKHIARLEAKIAKQAKTTASLEEQNALLRAQNETLKLRVDELERMVFGKHRRHPPGGSSLTGNHPGFSDTNRRHPLGSSSHPRAPSIKRSSCSYRRPMPHDVAMTSEETCPCDDCPDCGCSLKKRKYIERFIEDIPPIDTIKSCLHTLTKLSIETGYCPTCKKRKMRRDIPKQQVMLGGNIRAFICYASILQNQSYDQIIRFCTDVMGIMVSDGEITNILEAEKFKLVAECEAIKERIRQGSVVHYDETGWSVGQSEEQGNHAWTMANPGLGSEVAFLMGRSRGKGNAEELRGTNPNKHIAVTDDYGAYRNIFTRHQLCWAHPLRKFRDLAEYPSLESDTRERCKKTYEDFKLLYTKLRTLIDEENQHWKNTGVWRSESLEKESHTLLHDFDSITIPHSDDPKKLATYKATLKKNRHKYFTCLSGPEIPLDNNRAERALRHIVLKRRSSQGSKTQKGADVFSVLATVLLSLKSKYPHDFFVQYHALRS